MIPRVRWATGYARRVISQLRIDAPPINLVAIARHYDVEIREQVFPDDISGALHRGPDQAVIAVNSAHHLHRRRFTIAHELGHFLLHPDAPAYYDQEQQVGLHFRARVTGTAWNPKEVEANRFAAELLMPRKLILARVRDSVAVDAAQLAAEFNVSTQAMTYRLADMRFA